MKNFVFAVAFVAMFLTVSDASAFGRRCKNTCNSTCSAPVVATCSQPKVVTRQPKVVYCQPQCPGLVAATWGNIVSFPSRVVSQCNGNSCSK